MTIDAKYQNLIDSDARFQIDMGSTGEISIICHIDNRAAQVYCDKIEFMDKFNELVEFVYNDKMN